MEVVVSLQGVDQTQRKWSRIASRMTDVSHVWPEVTTALVESERRTYGKRVKLTDESIERKERAGKTEPMVWSDRLRSSLTSASGAGAVREYTPYSMTFGTSLFYARFQQKGTKRMAKHRVLTFSTTTRRLVANRIMAHVLKGE